MHLDNGLYNNATSDFKSWLWRIKVSETYFEACIDGNEENSWV